MSDWEYSEDNCPKCSEQLAIQKCWQCFGEGGWDGEDLMEDDPLWYDEDSYERCAECKGSGHLIWCRGCGWDVNFNQFINPKYEAEYLAKQSKV